MYFIIENETILNELYYKFGYFLIHLNLFILLCFTIMDIMIGFAYNNSYIFDWIKINGLLNYLFFILIIFIKRNYNYNQFNLKYKCMTFSNIILNIIILFWFIFGIIIYFDFNIANIYIFIRFLFSSFNIIINLIESIILHFFT